MQEQALCRIDTRLHQASPRSDPKRGGESCHHNRIRQLRLSTEMVGKLLRTDSRRIVHHASDQRENPCGDDLAFIVEYQVPMQQHDRPEQKDPIKGNGIWDIDESGPDNMIIDGQLPGKP